MRNKEEDPVNNVDAAFKCKLGNCDSSSCFGIRKVYISQANN